jgi:hypothetical protein
VAQLILLIDTSLSRITSILGIKITSTDCSGLFESRTEQHIPKKY